MVSTRRTGRFAGCRRHRNLAHLGAGACLEAKVEQNAAAIAQTREANAAAFAELRDAIRANGVAISATRSPIGKLTGQYEEHQHHHERLVARQTEQNP